MIKYIVIAVVIFLGGCHQLFSDMFGVGVQTKTMYLVPSESRMTDDFDDKFSWQCNNITDFLVTKNDVKSYLEGVGAVCNTFDDKCYFHILRLSDNKNYVFDIAMYDIKNRKYYPDVFTGNIENLQGINTNRIVKIIHKSDLINCGYYENNTTDREHRDQQFKKFIMENLNG
jgi:hypothetical protein